jgi:oligopeptide/dipeptide ABC transporter ATP-binding protein
MKQRAVIAMAMACRPDLIIADEPTTALDMVVQRQILSVITGLRDKHGIAILLISHDMGVVADVCQDIAVMVNGEIVEYGSRQEILGTPAHPCTRTLLKSYLGLDRETALPEFRPRRALFAAEERSGCRCHPACRQGDSHCRGCTPSWRELSPTHRVRCRC